MPAATTTIRLSATAVSVARQNPHAVVEPSDMTTGHVWPGRPAEGTWLQPRLMTRMCAWRWIASLMPALKATKLLARFALVTLTSIRSTSGATPRNWLSLEAMHPATCVPWSPGNAYRFARIGANLVGDKKRGMVDVDSAVEHGDPDSGGGAQRRTARGRPIDAARCREGYLNERIELHDRH